MENRSGTLDDFCLWQQQGLNDPYNQFQKAFAALKQSADLAHLLTFCDTIKKSTAERLVFVSDKKSTEYTLLRALQTQVGSLAELAKDNNALQLKFKILKNADDVLIALPKASRLLSYDDISAQKREKARTFYATSAGFLCITESDSTAPSWQLQINAASSFDSTGQSHTPLKWLVLSNFDMFLLDMNDDERQYSQGASILFCGEVTIEDGNLTSLSNCATHYPITTEQTFLMLMLMEKRIDINIADIMLDPSKLSPQKALDVLGVRLTRFSHNNNTWVLDELCLWLLSFAVIGPERMHQLSPIQASLIAKPDDHFKSILAIATYGLETLAVGAHPHPIVTKAFTTQHEPLFELINLFCKPFVKQQFKTIERSELVAFRVTTQAIESRIPNAIPHAQQHLFYSKKLGFLQLKHQYKKTPWQMIFSKVTHCTLENESPTKKKLLVLANKSMLLLSLDTDERAYTQGMAIVFCGKVIIQDGTLTHLSNFSQHYPMPVEQLFFILMRFEKMGIAIEKINLTVHEHTALHTHNSKLSVAQLFAQKGLHVLATRFGRDNENTPLWTINEFSIWLLLNTLLDQDKELHKAFAQLLKHHYLPTRIECFRTIMSICERQLSTLNDSTTDVHQILTKTQELFKHALDNLLADFCGLQVLNRTKPIGKNALVALAQHQSPLTRIDIVHKENRRVFFSKTGHFLRLKYHTTHEPWQLSINPVTTVKNGSNLEAVNKLVVLADRSMYLLYLNEDECQFTLGLPVLFCGEAKFSKGILTELNNVSNKYPMSEDQLTLMLSTFEQMSVNIDTIKVSKVQLSEETAIEVLNKHPDRFSNWVPRTPSSRSPRRQTQDPNDATTALMLAPVQVKRANSTPLFKNRSGSRLQIKPNGTRKPVQKAAIPLQKRYSHQGSLTATHDNVELTVEQQIALFFVSMVNWANQFKKHPLLNTFLSFLMLQRTTLLSENPTTRTLAENEFEQKLTNELALFNDSCQLTPTQKSELNAILTRAPWTLYNKNQLSSYK